MLCFTFIMKESYFIGYLLSCDTYRSGLWVLKPKTQNAKLRCRPESLRHHAALRREYHLKREIRRRSLRRARSRRRTLPVKTQIADLHNLFSVTLGELPHRKTCEPQERLHVAQVSGLSLIHI